MNSMRILQINDINQVATAYAEDLSKRGHKAMVCQPDMRGGFASLPIKLAMMPVRLLGLRHILKNLDPLHFDVAHIHWASYGILGLLGRIPFIVHCRGTDVRYRLQHPFFRVILRLVFQKAATVLCSTPDLLPMVQSLRPDASFFPGPIDTEQFAPEAERGVRPWTILLFARLDRIKGCDITVQGIARFAQRHPQVHVKLLAWGTENIAYQQHYGNVFEFVPRVSPDMAQYLLQKADVIVGQVFLGAFGLSELQAMSCAKPVITSFNYENVYSTSPYFYQATTIQEVDAQLECIFQQQDMAQEVGVQARQWVIEHHGREALTDRLEHLYRAALVL